MRATLLFLGLLGATVGWSAEALLSTSPVTSVQAGRPDAAQARYMKAHLNQALVVHAAVIRGDLPAVVPAARTLAALDDSRFPPGAPAQVAAMKAAALRAVDSRDALAAGLAAAEMLTACGNCHRAIGTRPAIPSTERPAVGGVVGHMLEHQVAADLLLEGLVIPSDTSWRAGAQALMKAPLNPRELPVDSAVRRQLAPTEERIHRLATDAVQATDSAARAGFYGQVLAGCADCHKLHAKIWGPKPPGLRW